MLTPAFIALALLGSLSPLLTFLWLFQLKEWRLDRLGEHLRQKNGWQAVGGPLPVITLIIWILAYSLYLGPTTLSVLLVLAGISLGQFATKRQRLPDWTKKALLIAGLAGLINLISAIVVGLKAPTLLPFFNIIQMPVVLVAWAVTLPIDRCLKQKIFAAAKARRDSLPHLTVIGIVGSVGKTTTKELISAALAGRQPLVTPAHVNTELGIANWFLRETKDWPATTARPLVVEMGAYRQGEIALISRVIRPSMAVITALGSDHLALFGSEESIDSANAEILAALPPDSAAILLADHPRTVALGAQCPGRIVLAGEDASADVRAERVHEDASTGLNFTVDETQFSVPLSGRHNVGNVTLAIAVADALGITRTETAANLSTIQPLPGTFNVRVKNGRRYLDDTYNISPLSLKAALTWAGNQPERPRVLLTAGLL